MDVLQHDFYFWKMIHHYVIHKGYRLLERNEKEAWIEDSQAKPKRVFRVVRIDVDWANALRKDVLSSLKRFEFVRRNLHMNQLIGENIYVTIHPPVDSWEDVKKPYYAHKNKKTAVFTSLFTKEDAENSRIISSGIDELVTVEDIESAIIEMKSEIDQKVEKMKHDEYSLFTYGKPTVTYAFLITIAVMFAILEMNGGSSSILTLIEYGAKYNPLIIEGEWWRLFTAMFLHIGFLHFFMNSLALYYLGSTVERMYGSWRFVIIYFVAGLFGSLASFALNDNVAAGASGAIFGCFGALLYFGTVHKGLFFRTMGRNVLFILGLNLVFGFTMPMIDNGAHVGGLIGGFLAAAVVHLPKHERSVKQVSGFVIMVITFTSLLLIGLTVKEKFPSPMLSLQIGQEYIEREELEEAYPYLQDALDAGVDVAEAPFLLAYVEANFENYEAAEALFLEAVEKRKDFHEAYFNLGLIYFELGDAEKSQEYISKAIEYAHHDEVRDTYIELQKELNIK